MTSGYFGLILFEISVRELRWCFRSPSLIAPTQVDGRLLEFLRHQGIKPEKAVFQRTEEQKNRRTEAGIFVKEHLILGTDEQDAERRLDIWLAENPALKVLRVHHPKREPHNWLTRLGGRNVPRFSITVEYEEA